MWTTHLRSCPPCSRRFEHQHFVILQVKLQKGLVTACRNIQKGEIVTTDLWNKASGVHPHMYALMVENHYRH